MARRSFEEEKAFLEKLSPNAWKIKKGFVPNMKVGLLSGAVYCAREVVLKLAVCGLCAESACTEGLAQTLGACGGLSK